MSGQRVRLTNIGWDEDLQLEQSDDVSNDPSADHVRIAVEACGVCYRDLIDRSGRFPFIQLPITPGHEVVGRVEAVGPAVSDWAIGDRVASMHRDFCGECPPCKEGETSLCLGAAAVPGLLIDGGYATHMTAPQRVFYRAPDDVDAAQAAVMHCTFGTSYRGLKAARIASGSRIVVTGANGGVGLAAIQVATRLGAQVVAVVRSAAHGDALEALGAGDIVVNTDGRFHKSLPGAPVDAVIDCVGPPTFNASLRSLRPGGSLIVIGNIVQEKVAMNLGHVITKGLRIIGSSGATRSDMAELYELQGDRPFELTVTERLPLAEADRVQRALQDGGVRGRFVLVPSR